MHERMISQESRKFVKGLVCTLGAQGVKGLNLYDPNTKKGFQGMAEYFKERVEAEPNSTFENPIYVLNINLRNNLNPSPNGSFDNLNHLIRTTSGVRSRFGQTSFFYSEAFYQSILDNDFSKAEIELINNVTEEYHRSSRT